MNLFEHLDKTDEQLSKLNTRHLKSIHDAAYYRNTCSCGPKYHCGDDVLTEEERQENAKIRAFQFRVRAILQARPPIPVSTQATRREAAKKGR